MKPVTFIGNANRAKQIVGVFVKHGFADLLAKIDLPAGLLRRVLPHPIVQRTHYERLRLALEDLGPAFIKAGQLLSMRPDVLPDALILELRKLQKSVRAEPFDTIRQVLIEELGAPPDEVFAGFEETPTASASLAQVHFATLKDGRAVAVKVQRPHLRRTIEADISLLAWFAGRLHQHIEKLRPYDLPAVAAEVGRGLRRELDFRNEARNQRYFNALNPHPDRVFSPDVVDALSSERVLVMDRIDGVSVDSKELPPELARRVAANGASSLLDQVLIRGFFHADPHLGNVLVTPDGRLCFLDWGMVGHLTRRLRYALADLFLAAAEQDAERIATIASELGSSGAKSDIRAMERDITLALREDFNRDIDHVELGRAMLKLLFIFGQNEIPMTRDYSLMAKAVLSIEEVASTLDPQFDLRACARPVLAGLRKERISPKSFWREALFILRGTFSGLRDFPGGIHRIIRRIEHGDLTIQFHHQGLDTLDGALKTSANRIALGFICGCLIIGSSLIVAAEKGNVSLFSAFGYALAAVIGAYVVYGIFREKR